MRSFLLVALMLAVSSGSHGEGTLSLRQKADLFQQDMEERFLLEGQALCKLKLPTPSREFIAYNMPDNAYMTGIYTGTLAMKYAVTGDAQDKAAALQSLEALHLLCAVSGVPGVLARAAWPKDKPKDDDGIWRDSVCGRYVWRGDVSTDQVAGVMFGFALAYELIAEDTEKARIGQDAAAIVRHVLENDMRIVDVDGKPTQWGRYDPRYVSRTEQMNALLWLQAVKVAEKTTGENAFRELYHHWAVEEGYAEKAVSARRKALPAFRNMVNHSDDVLIFLAYIPLLMFEQDETLRPLLLASVKRTWEGEDRFPGVKPEQNPVYAFTVAKFLEDASGVQGGVDTLRWFPVDMKWSRDTVARYQEQYTFQLSATPASPEPKAGEPVPVNRRVKTWSAWVQDPYHSAGERGIDDGMEYNGHDYLLAYWMGRYYGYLDDKQ